MKRIAAFCAKEAAAYLRSGLLAPSLGRDIPENHERSSSFGVVLVPGVGANPSQLSLVKRALREDVGWFDAFDYSSFAHPRSVAAKLRDHLDEAGTRCERLLVIGHSLGGLLLRVALQSDRAPRAIAGFISICAPLHGTWRSKLAPSPHLRDLAPDSAFMTEVLANAHRLDRLRGAMLMVGSSLDHFIAPSESAFLEGEERLCLDDTGHVGSLFDPRVHEAILRLARRVSSAADPAVTRAVAS
jgi:pimeloyl-ACP methyl ester carboxylesterase